MTRQTHTIDGIAWCGTLEVTPPFVGMRDATAGACSVIPPVNTPLFSNVAYPNSPGSGIRPQVNIRDFGQVFGHRNSTDTVVPFPGAAGSSPAILQFPGDKIVAMQFVVPMTPYHGIVGCSSYYGHTVDIGISTNPNVFPTDPRYWSRCGPGDGGPQWSNHYTNMALVNPGQTYYYVFRLSTPQPGLVSAAFNSVVNSP